MDKEVQGQDTSFQSDKVHGVIKVGICGVTGYTGTQLYKLLSSHPFANITYVSSEEYIGYDINDIFPYFPAINNLKCKSFNPVEAANACDLIFLALPHTVSLKVVPELINAKSNIKIIDLSADFRFATPELYEKWYREKHTCPELLTRSVYGLCEIFSENIKKASIIANPGCYPTSILLPLLPLCKHLSIDTKNINISSISGISGAGKKLNPAFLFAECNENLRAYTPMTHRHTPEIEFILSNNLNQPVEIYFTPHLAPVTRGILSTIFLTLSDSNNCDEDFIYNTLTNFYQNCTFIKIYRGGKLPTTKEVIGTNFCCMGFSYNKSSKRLIVISVIDNLIKGASGQAIQNMNLMFNFPETCGLTGGPQIP